MIKNFLTNIMLFISGLFKKKKQDITNEELIGRLMTRITPKIAYEVELKIKDQEIILELLKEALIKASTPIIQREITRIYDADEIDGLVKNIKQLLYEIEGTKEDEEESEKIKMAPLGIFRAKKPGDKKTIKYKNCTCDYTIRRKDANGICRHCNKRVGFN